MPSCECLKFTRGSIYFSPQKDCNSFCDTDELIFKKLGKLISAEVVNDSDIVGVESPYLQNYDPKARRSIGPSRLSLTFYWEENFLSDYTESDSGSFTQILDCINGSLGGGFLWYLKKSGIDPDSVRVFLDDLDAETSTGLTRGVDFTNTKTFIDFTSNIVLGEDERLRTTYDFDDKTKKLRLDKDVLLSGTLFFVGTNIGDEKKQFNVLFPRCFFDLDNSLTLNDDGQFSQSNLNVKIELGKNKELYEILKG